MSQFPDEVREYTFTQNELTKLNDPAYCEWMPVTWYPETDWESTVICIKDWDDWWDDNYPYTYYRRISTEQIHKVHDDNWGYHQTKP